MEQSFEPTHYLASTKGDSLIFNPAVFDSTSNSVSPFATAVSHDLPFAGFTDPYPLNPPVLPHDGPFVTMHVSHYLSE